MFDDIRHRLDGAGVVRRSDVNSDIADVECIATGNDVSLLVRCLEVTVVVWFLIGRRRNKQIGATVRDERVMRRRMDVIDVLVSDEDGVTARGVGCVYRHWTFPGEFRWFALAEVGVDVDGGLRGPDDEATTAKLLD